MLNLVNCTATLGESFKTNMTLFLNRMSLVLLEVCMSTRAGSMSLATSLTAFSELLISRSIHSFSVAVSKADF